MRIVSGARAAVAAAMMAGGLVMAGANGAAVHAAPLDGIADCGGPYSGVTGQPVTMKAAVSGVRGVLTYFWHFGDDNLGDDHNPTSHAYAAPGTYHVMLRVASSTLDGATCDTTVTIGAGGVVATPAPQAAGSGLPFVGTPSSRALTATYTIGWNMVSGPTGAVFSQASGTLYTFQAGDDTYESLASSSGVTGGFGYWAYFAVPTVIRFSQAGDSSATIEAPAGQWVMVGNPSGTTALTVRGADSVLRYDPESGSYLAVTRLQPGQAAWAISLSSGEITVGP